MDIPTGCKLGIVRGISYGVFGPPDSFMPETRKLGSRFARVYLTWNQLEPRPGRFDWKAVDALLEQLEPDDEIWVTVVSASRWGSRRPTDFLPASPPRDSAAYQQFIAALVTRCAGKIAYWQCNNEPSNPGLWMGSAADYADLQAIFAKTVREADPAAKIVLGGCGYDVLSAAPDAPPRAFFAEVLDKARENFDLLSLHLYDDPANIPAHFDTARAMMAACGYQRPIVAGEVGGPTLLGFPALEPVMAEMMAEAFAAGAPSLDSAALASGAETQDRRAMRRLYERMPELPPELQMFMRGCAPTLEARRHRICCREVVTRTLLAMASGASRTLWWDLAPEVPNYRDKYNLMGFLSDKLALLDFVRGKLTKREPAAATFALLAGFLEGAVEVRRLPSEDGVIAIEILRGPADANVTVLWLAGDPMGGEDDLPRLTEWPWAAPVAHLADAFGLRRDVPATAASLSLALTTTPVFLTA
jgi:hypothetical protein